MGFLLPPFVKGGEGIYGFPLKTCGNDNLQLATDNSNTFSINHIDNFFIDVGAISAQGFT